MNREKVLKVVAGTYEELLENLIRDFGAEASRAYSVDPAKYESDPGEWTGTNDWRLMLSKLMHSPYWVGEWSIYLTYRIANMTGVK